MISAALHSSRAAYAAPSANATYEMVTKIKTVSFNLRNDSKVEMKVKAGESEITLEPGKAVPVKLAIGEKVVMVEDSPGHPAGTVVVVSGWELNHSTVVFR
ncbi:hypothetical protein ACPOL_2277 [Acidisarcina polymorpha]|uniref:Uncharacterized protein n=2 Tax=Acidisarcina polymorpha TaxID=2211140 RepID=A0A2Z5FXL5_9BACT|nr:hypothetical protein ACPOL_2277 [Acidisarcina polymorpha]